jgi:hypothetical protein
MEPKPGDNLLVYFRNNGTPVRDATNNVIAQPKPDEPMNAVIGRVYMIGKQQVVDIVGVDVNGGSFFEKGMHILEDGEKIPRGRRYAEYAGRTFGGYEEDK